MKSTFLLVSALFFGLSLFVCEAAAQRCTEGKCQPCVVAGKKGSRCCENGRLAACVPEIDQDQPPCDTKGCTAGKVCQDGLCVSSCEQGFTDCGGFCKDINHDSANCGSCNNVCRSGTSCQQSTQVILGRTVGGLPPPTSPPSSVCACIPPTVECGGACRNPVNDPSNCGACGIVCAAPTTACRDSKCELPEGPQNNPTAGSTGTLPLDLFWSTTDPNGLPFNPAWRAQPTNDEGGLDPVDLASACPACQPDAKCLATCAGNPSGCNQCFPPQDECWKRCTTFPITFDGSLFVRVLSCQFAHINWRPATYDGGLDFNDYSARGFFSGIGADDDYKFNLRATGGAGLATRPTQDSEMAYLETVDRFDSAFWKRFRDLVDDVPGDDLSGPRALFAGRYAILIGLVGLDLEHGVHSEIHPIYAMALRESENPNRSCWAMFARNWGNEGFCSSHVHHLDLTHITFRLPQPNATISTPPAVPATAVTETSREFKTNSNLVAVSEVGLVQGNAEVTVTLGPSDDRTFVNGELCLRWSMPPGTQTLRVATEPDQDAYPGTELLTPEQLAQIQSSLPAPPPRNERNATLDAQRVPFAPAAAAARAPVTVLGDHVGPVDTQRQDRDQQIQSRICELLRDNPERPKICDQI